MLILNKYGVHLIDTCIFPVIWSYCSPPNFHAPKSLQNKFCVDSGNLMDKALKLKYFAPFQLVFDTAFMKIKGSQTVCK
jgi:hypothetical protein